MYVLLQTTPYSEARLFVILVYLWNQYVRFCLQASCMALIVYQGRLGSLRGYLCAALWISKSPDLSWWSLSPSWWEVAFEVGLVGPPLHCNSKAIRCSIGSSSLWCGLHVETGFLPSGSWWGWVISVLKHEGSWLSIYALTEVLVQVYIVNYHLQRFVGRYFLFHSILISIWTCPAARVGDCVSIWSSGTRRAHLEV